jgi:endonuclease/exonuclease/phosphatase family metal-dependent hydrolase
MSIKTTTRGVLLALLLTSAGSAVSDCLDAADEAAVITADYLRLLTLNIAHGRKDGRNQMFQKTETIRANLSDAAQVLRPVEAHLIGLQEADAASSWSGKFDHVDFLAAETGYSCYFHGIHASNRIYDFGTALLARQPLQGVFTHSFKPSKPTTTKGFVAGGLLWNPENSRDEPMLVKVISVHLDFSRKSVRRSQVEEMVGLLSKIDGPMVVMGDFNSDWQHEDSSVKHLAESLGLHAFEPQAEGLGTYGEKGARLDWILISPDVRFRRYAVIPDVISDHYAVAAEIVLKDHP